MMWKTAAKEGPGYENAVLAARSKDLLSEMARRIESKGTGATYVGSAGGQVQFEYMLPEDGLSRGNYFQSFDSGEMPSIEGS